MSAFLKSGTATKLTPTCTSNGWQSRESGAEDLCYIFIPFLSHHLQADVFYKNTNSVAKSILERGSQHIFHNAWCPNVFDTSKSPDQLNVRLRPDAFCILPSHLLLSKPFRNTGGYLYNMSVLPSANHFLLIRFTFRWKEIKSLLPYVNFFF